MKKPLNWIIGILLFSLSSHAFAICENERIQFLDWNSKCEKLAAASQITGAAGGVFALVTFGASLIPCATAIAAAQNACRIKDEKQQNLLICQSYHANLTKRAQEVTEATILAEQARQDRISHINTDFSNRRAQIVQLYDEMIQAFVNEITSEGWNTEDPESQELIRATRSTMEHERDQRLDQLESERKQALTNA